ncbi:MAG: GerMN domain-containing protein [Lachnospiraceae bacterium]|nr:GerMN domain-containing protein [Lachnospiraceae bacterium]MBQ9136205.1 GerMN domain-containing protein [Lachnospiraceae bacterium]
MRKNRRVLSLLLTCMCIFQILLFAGCGSSEPVGDEGVSVIFYINNAETRVERQAYEIQATDTEGQLEELITQLGTIPDKLEYKAPLQMGFSLLSYRVEGETLHLDVSEEYRGLKATTEVLIRAALVRTFSQVTGIKYVSITVAGEPLLDTLGNAVGLMTAEQFVDNAGDEINAYEKVRIKLYFANEEGTGLIATNRTVVYNTNIPIEKLVVEELLEGPGQESDGELFPVINPETKIVSVTVKDNVCYVNFNEVFLTQIYTVTPEVAIYSIVNSLEELPNVNKVQISINGETDVMYRESISLSTVFERNLELLTTAN